MHNFEEGTEF